MSNRLAESIQIINKNSFGFDEETTHVITKNILSSMIFSNKLSQYVKHGIMEKLNNFELAKNIMTYKTFLDKINSLTLNEKQLENMLKRTRTQKMLCEQNPLYEIYLNEFGVLKDFDYTKKFSIRTQPRKSKRNKSTRETTHEISKLIELNSVKTSKPSLKKVAVVIIMFDIMFKNYFIISKNPNFKKTLIDKIRSFADCEDDGEFFKRLANKYSLPTNLLEIWLDAMENN